MAYKETSNGNVYVPRGSTVEPCPGCGGDTVRKKDKVCGACAEKIEKWESYQASQSKLGETTAYAMNERAYALPYVPYETEGRETSSRDPIRERFFDLSMLMSSPSEATYKDKPPSLWPHEQLNASRNEWRIYRDIKPEIARLLGELFYEVAITTTSAYRKGVSDGKNLLLSLASGKITNDEFNNTAARLTGKKDEE